MRGAKENRCLADFLVTIPGQCVLTTLFGTHRLLDAEKRNTGRPDAQSPGVCEVLPMTKDESPRRRCGGGSCCSIQRPIGDRIFPLCSGGMEPVARFRTV